MVGRGKKGRYVNGLLKTAKSFIQYCYDEGYGGFNTKKNFKWCREEKVIILTFKPSHTLHQVEFHVLSFYFFLIFCFSWTFY